MVLEPTPAFCNERIHLFLATQLKPGKNHPDDGEFLSAVTMPLSEAVTLVMEGKIRDGKTAIGILMASRILSSD